jgi:GNAT superfamily N-acetyltransferase
MSPRLSDVRAVVADIGCLARRDGARRTLATLARGVTDNRRDDGELIVLAKRLDDVARIEHAGTLRVEDLRPSALPELAALNRACCSTRADARFAASLAKGHRGFVARRGSGAVGYYWWVDSRIDAGHPHLDRLGIDLADDDVYGFDFFLAEQHRGAGNAHQFLEHVETRLGALGYGTLWGYVRSDNTPARWLYGVRGYAEAGRVQLPPGRMRM